MLPEFIYKAYGAIYGVKGLFYCVERTFEGSVESPGEVGGHTDAPRLDLKPKPLYEKGGYVYFDCHIYGGIKKYQWLVLPLALYGTVVRKDGTKVQIAVGDKDGDPVFMISDILPHLGKDQEQKKVSEFFPAEDLDVFCWTTSKELKSEVEDRKVKNLVVEYLKKTYKITEEDSLLSIRIY